MLIFDESIGSRSKSSYQIVEMIPCRRFHILDGSSGGQMRKELAAIQDCRRLLV